MASLVAIILVLLPLIRLYIRLHSDRQPIPKRIALLTKIPVSIYCAWLTVATIVNTACTLHFVGWQASRNSAELWTISLLLEGIVLAGFVCLKYRDVAFGGVFVWAWLAIAAKNSDSSLIQIVAITSAVL